MSSRPDLPSFTRGDYGSGPRLAATGFLVFGLLTGWVYSVLRFAGALRAHSERRWREVTAGDGLSGVDLTLLDSFRKRGFTVELLVPRVAATLFALCAALVAYWYFNWIVVGDESDYGTIMTAVGASSALFYAGCLLTMLWALGAVRGHETSELLVRELGANALAAQAAEPGDELVRRWERLSNRIVLFLVVALPIACAPTFAAHLFLVGTSPGRELWMPLACFLLAGVFHVWGTLLLVGLYNDHLAFETQQAPAMPQPVDDRVVAAANGDIEAGATRRELAAIMLTDMFGYSKAMERDEGQAYAKLMQHNLIMRNAIAAHHGREIKTIGDAFLVLFKSAIDAVDCALAAQRAFADFNLGKEPADQVLVRIGIHIGDVLVTSNDVFGDGVNVAARIEPHAEPGGVCISEPVFEMVRKKLELDVSRLEGATLKNIAAPPALYRIRLGS